MSNRIEKANSVLQRKISQIIQNDLNDPRLNGQLISVSSVNMSSDLKYAKVFLSIFGSPSPETSLLAIQNASGYIRKELANEIKFRSLPELHFVLDTGAEYSEQINNVIKNISFADENNYNESNYNDNDHNNKH